MKRFLVWIMIVVLALSVFACAKKDKDSAKEENKTTVATTENTEKPKEPVETQEPKPETPTISVSNYPMEFEDFSKKMVKLEKKPERIVALSGTTLNLISKVGGQVIASPSLSEGAPKPDYYDNVEHLGFMANIDVEKLISLEPDFVLAQGMNRKVIPILEENNIPVYFFAGKTFEEICSTLRLFAKAIDNEEVGNQVVDKMEKDYEDIMAKIPKDDEKTVAIVYVSGDSINLELPHSIAGSIAKRMGLKNIADGMESEGRGANHAPFNLEAIVEANPDVIFVTSMISADKDAKEVLTHHIQDSAAWNAVPAVKEGRMYVLPQSHFLFNPIDKFPEAALMMAKPLWPEVFKD